MGRARAFVVQAELALRHGCDPRAPGGAVTVALCGQPEHAGPCRWPHNSAIDANAQPAPFRTLFVADEPEERVVRALVESSLRNDRDWSVVSVGTREVAGDEQGLAQSLLAVPRAGEEARQFLLERHPEVADLALWLRAVVLGAEPDLDERVYHGWDGVGFRHPDGGYVCALYPRPPAVRLLFEHGTRLEDPYGVLEGAGTQTRHVDVAAPDAELGRRLGELVRDAVAERLYRR